MLSVLFGVGAALGFGSSDFLGGLAARQIGSIRAVWAAASTALISLYFASFFVGGAPSSESWLYGGLSGAAAVFALVCLYASLAIGPMSILSPIGAVIGAVVPSLWDIFTGQALQWYAYVAIVIALVAVAIVGFTPGQQVQKVSAKGMALALSAGTFFGIYYILLDLAPDDAGLWPLIANRSVSVSVLTIAVVCVAILRWVRRQSRAAQSPNETADLAAGDVGVIHWRAGLQFALITGVIEALGTALYLYGIVSGSLTVVSVVTSLYPASTIILATIVLNERLGKLQYVGLSLAVVAALGLALA